MKRGRKIIGLLIAVLLMMPVLAVPVSAADSIDVNVMAYKEVDGPMETSNVTVTVLPVSKRSVESAAQATMPEFVSNMFGFVLLDSEEKVVRKAANGAGPYAGDIQFPSINYTSPGTYTYTLREIGLASALNEVQIGEPLPNNLKNPTSSGGWTFDPKVYTVEILIEEENGVWTATQTNKDERGEIVYYASFTNKWEEPDTSSNPSQDQSTELTQPTDPSESIDPSEATTANDPSSTSNDGPQTGDSSPTSYLYILAALALATMAALMFRRYRRSRQ